MSDDTEPSMKSLREELDEALRTNALLKAEKDEAQARHTLQLEEAVARLNAEKDKATTQLKAQLEAKGEAVRKLTAVVAEINSDATLQARRRRADATATSVEPLDPDNPMVRKVGANVLSQNTTINDCRTDVTIHEDPEVLLAAILNDQTNVGKALFQKVVEEGVAYWSFIVTNTKSCNLLLRMWVERQDEDGIVVRVESVDKEELKATPLPNPHSTASKKFRLIFKEGAVILRPLQFGQTSFTFTAQVDVGELMKDTAVETPSKLGRFTAATANKRNKSNSAKKVVVGSETGKGNEFFCKLAGFFYERFKKEDDKIRESSSSTSLE
ncbi:hypothetical protein TrVE_jg11901 [Triparma verrucosa]|uniref:Uncharacterized protein n=1 Tax=Triparma verrucosa TaxID=1606542 RepID=A0A9W7BXK8_9STRA|nr:hypothetical protein TrVE_jg11901 [Triparma verrucosa]